MSCAGRARGGFKRPCRFPAIAFIAGGWLQSTSARHVFRRCCGVHIEYHYLPAAAPKGNWAVSCFKSDGSQRAWRVVEFPNDGHPELCNAVLDLTGDCRDEIVVWDPWEIWVYTQSDNPKAGRFYKHGRNPLYNYSSYQTTVSLPGWSE